MKLSKDDLGKIRKAIEEALDETYGGKVRTDKQVQFFDLAIKKIKDMDKHEKEK